MSPKVISFMVKSEQNTEYKSTRIERHRTPSRTSQTTSDKMTVMLSLRALRDITENLEPYKIATFDTPLTTHARIIDYDERRSKLLQWLDLDSQRISQSSQAIQSTLESLFNLLSSN